MRVALIVQAKAKLLHLVFMSFSVKAVDTEVIILTNSAVPSGLHVVLALIACVYKAILALVVKFHQHAHS